MPLASASRSSPAPKRGRPRLPCAAALLLVALAGCGEASVSVDASAGTSVDGEQLADDITEALPRRLPPTLRVTRATCPERVPVKKQVQRICAVTFSSGDRGPVDVTFTSDDGSRSDVQLVYALMRHLEDQIEGSERKMGIKATVRCPTKPRPIRKKDRWTCVATDAEGDRGVFDVRQTGRDGVVNITLRQ